MKQFTSAPDWGKKFAVLTFVFVLLLAVTACAPGSDATATSDATITSPTSNNDEVEAYATVIEQIYTVHDTFGGTLQPATVYLLSQTDDAVGGPDIEPMASETIDATTQQAIVSGLADLPAEWVWVSSRDEVPINPDTGAIEGDAVLITLGNIHPQPDQSLHVPGSIYVANMAAGGQTFILTQTDGIWAVSGTSGEWMS